MIFDDVDAAGAATLTIKVFGVGTAGCKSVNSMIEARVRDVEFYQVDTDYAQLRGCIAKNRIVIGKKTTRLQKAQTPAKGEEAALESIKELKKAVAGARVLFVVTGLGGGCGSGASPIIAKLAKEAGALVISVVTKPFPFEKLMVHEFADEGLKRLKTYADTVTMIQNGRLLNMLSSKATVNEAFTLVDTVVEKCVKAVSDVMTTTGMVNIDIADITSVMKEKGSAYLGIGYGSGPNKLEDAINEALSNPLLDREFPGARQGIISITSRENLSIVEVSTILNRINQANTLPMNTFYGQIYDQLMEEDLKITIISTGYMEI